MGEWFNPVMNTSLAVGLVGFFCWFISREWWPVYRAQMEANRRKTESEAKLADDLSITQVQQSSLLERSVGMLHDHGIKLGSHGELLTLQGKQIERQGRLLERIDEAVRKQA